MAEFELLADGALDQLHNSNVEGLAEVDQVLFVLFLVDALVVRPLDGVVDEAARVELLGHLDIAQQREHLLGLFVDLARRKVDVHILGRVLKQLDVDILDLANKPHRVLGVVLRVEDAANHFLLSH